jgi:sugar (pentulose or hexulose) kinase
MVVQAMVIIKKEGISYKPDKEIYGTYMKIYKKYKDLYKALKDLY